MVKTGTTVNINKVPEVLAAMRFLAGNRVLVGIPAEKNEREDEDGNTTPIGNAAIGFIQENGDPEMHLPARPWLKPGVATVNDQTTIALKKAGKAALDGDKGKAQKIYIAIGLRAQGAVQRYMRNSGNFEPLSERTLEARRARNPIAM
jgi:hypothetical protein